MIFEVWENELPIEAFAQDVLGWPAPKDGHAYTYEEVKKHSANHTRKFTGGLLAAMVLTLYLNEAESLKIAKYIGVDPKKLRKQASAAVKEEDDKAAQPREPKTKEEKQLHAAMHSYDGAGKRWEKLRGKGASDAELLKAVKREMESGVKVRPFGKFACRSVIPAIWFNSDGTNNGPASLREEKLVVAVRELLNIRQEGDA
jgi:hypothetical protein